MLWHDDSLVVTLFITAIWVTYFGPVYVEVYQDVKEWYGKLKTREQ